MKSADRSAMKAMLRHAAIINDPASTEEMKDQARDNILAISGKKAAPAGSAVKTSKEKLSDLESAMEGVKPDLTNKLNEKISNTIKGKAKEEAGIKKEMNEAASEKRAKIRAHERIHGRQPGHSHGIDPFEWENLHPNAKKFLTEKEHPEKKAKREEWNHDNQVLPESQYTRKELESQSDRAQGITKPKKVEPRERTAAEKVTSAQKKVKSTIDSALSLVHDAHANGLHDKAAEILHAIPREHMPSNMKGYNPAFIHYDVTPNHWAGLAPEHREHLQNIHMDIMNGKHDNNPDPGVQKIVNKVKPLPKPSSS